MYFAHMNGWTITPRPHKRVPRLPSGNVTCVGMPRERAGCVQGWCHRKKLGQRVGPM